jgi:hypothetical protein
MLLLIEKHQYVSDRKTKELCLQEKNNFLLFPVLQRYGDPRMIAEFSFFGRGSYYARLKMPM